MAAYGAVTALIGPAASSVAAFGARVAGIGLVTGPVIATPQMVPLIASSFYTIAGTQSSGRVVPIWGQIFPRGDNQW
ncbi:MULTISPECIES: hypothetical protein [unclassified Microbacterium]|uniref:hypothetical protein n=1 Tax=unclassified Microbacterium TaxID=2609290 RepID=UPI003656699F